MILALLIFCFVVLPLTIEALCLAAKKPTPRPLVELNPNMLN